MMVPTPPEYQAVRVGLPQEGETYITVLGVPMPGPCEFPSVIVEPADKGWSIEDVECVAPEGWVATEWRVPQPWDYFLNGHQVTRCHRGMSFNWPIVLPAVTVEPGPGDWNPCCIKIPEEGEHYLDLDYGEVTMALGGGTYHELVMTTDPGSLLVPVYGVPEEYKPIAWRVPKIGELILDESEVVQIDYRSDYKFLILEKIDG